MWPIGLLQVGGATGRVGDPSGRGQEREELAEELLLGNTTSITRCLEDIFHNDQKMRGAGADIRFERETVCVRVSE